MDTLRLGLCGCVCVDNIWITHRSPSQLLRQVSLTFGCGVVRRLNYAQRFGAASYEQRAISGKLLKRFSVLNISMSS